MVCERDFNLNTTLCAGLTPCKPSTPAMSTAQSIGSLLMGAFDNSYPFQLRSVLVVLAVQIWFTIFMTVDFGTPAWSILTELIRSPVHFHLSRLALRPRGHCAVGIRMASDLEQPKRHSMVLLRVERGYPVRSASDSQGLSSEAREPKREQHNKQLQPLHNNCFKPSNPQIPVQCFYRLVRSTCSHFPIIMSQTQRVSG